MQLIDEQEEYYSFLRELKRNPWKSIPSKSEAKIKNPVTHLMEYQSYLEFSLNLDGYMDTLRVLENELGCYNLSTIVNKLIRAKHQQEVDNVNKIINKRKLVDMGDRDEDMLFKRKSADSQTYVVASVGGAASETEGGAAAASEAEDGARSSSSKGATGGAGCGGGATGGGGGGATGGAGEGVMGEVAGVERLSAPDLVPSVAKNDEDGGE